MNHFRQSRFRESIASLGKRFRRLYERTADTITSWTIGSSFFRRISETRRQVAWKIRVLVDEFFHKLSALIRRKSAPGRRAKSKLLAAGERTWNATAAPVINRTAQPLHQARHQWNVFWDEFGQKVSNDPRLRILVAPFRWAYRALALCVDFFVAWFGTRNYRSLLFGLPAMLLFLPLLICLIRIPLYGAHARATQYQRAAFEAIQDEEYGKADLLFRKLTQMGIDRPSVIFSEATVLAEEGELAAAYAKMNTIAPLETGGFAPAHYWIAKTLFTKAVYLEPSERYPLIESHLKYALAQAPHDPFATQMLGEVYRETNRPQEANSLLDELPGMRFGPNNQARLARTYAKWGRPDDAKQLAELAHEGFGKRVAAGDSLELTDYLLWVAATELAERDDQTMDVLQIALDQLRDADDGIQEFAERMSCGVLDANWNTGQTKRETWLRLAQRGLQIERLREPILRNIVNKAVLDVQTAKRVREMLLPLKDSGVLSLPSRQLLADLTLVTGDFEAAKSEYSQIAAEAPTNIKAFNNLAWIYSHVKPLDLPKALQFANQAVSLASDDSSILETRGQILTSLGRWREAAADLEAAANGLPESYRVHQSLSICYEKTNQPQLAAAHRERMHTLEFAQH